MTWQPFTMLMACVYAHTWRPISNSLRVESLMFAADSLLPASLLLGYMSSDWCFQDPIWNPFVSFVLRVCLHVLGFKLSLWLCQKKKKWADPFNKLKIHWNIIPPLVIMMQTFHFGEWPYSVSLQGAGWIGVSLLTFLSLFCLLTYPLENHLLPINSSFLFLESRVCL